MSRPHAPTGTARRDGILSRVVRLGPARSTVVITAIACSASLVISFAVTTALHRFSLMGALISVGIPALLTPLTWYPFTVTAARLRGAESRLAASEERFRSILETMSDAYVEFDGEGVLVFRNPAFDRIAGGGPGPGRITELVGAEDFRRLTEAAAADRAGGGLHEFPVTARDGSARTLEASVLPPSATSGAPPVFRAVLRDVTERVNREREREEHREQLRRARKMEALGTLAGGVAHDLNNVLGGIVGYPDLLLLECPQEGPFRKSLLAIKESGERAAGIVQDLLTLARRGLSATRVVDLNRVVADYLASPEHAALLGRHSQVRVSTRLDEQRLTIEGSPVHIATSVMNLVLNALEATPAGGTVALETGRVYLDEPLRAYDAVRPGDYVTLTVTDSGTGIAPEDLERIFEPFYTKKALGRSGSGLGMAVVWGTVKDHEGYVDVRSEVGKGTEVRLFFPASGRELPPLPAAGGIEAHAGHGERVLVVDDLGQQRALAATLLERLGYRVTTAGSGGEAVASLESAPADLVLLDMILEPGRDGLDTCRRIFELRPGQRVVIVSGYSESDRVREALRIGCRAYLRKPYSLEVLARVVHEALAGEGAS